MSNEALYERYKDALKRGHVASVRGHLDEALEAYAEAASIVPERATPHTSAGTALLRRGRPGEAVRQYEAALRRAPRDEAALLGRARALVALDRRSEAAAAFDALADLRSESGKLADAVDASRRALELAEGRERRRALGQLIERLRRSEPAEPGRQALERALLILEGPAVTGQAAPGAAAAEGPGGDGVPSAGGEHEPEPGLEGPTAFRALDRDVPDDVDLAALVLEAEAVTGPGDATTSARFLDLAAAAFRTGRVDAALDACYQGLSLDPDDVNLHLALVQLYDERGWSTLAGEKLDLLARIADLDGDPDAAGRVAAARVGRG